jgi:Protein of unknown function (DUF2845)
MGRALIVVLLSCAPALAGAQSLRCGSKIIDEGTDQVKVAALCGQPTQIERRGPIFNGQAVDGVSDIQVEVWTYNFGPNKFMQRIRFENGVVVKIDSLGYGF